MTDVYCFAFVEDAPSAAVADKLVAARNARLEHLLTVIRRKGKKKIHQEMLPKGAAHIGPLYNEVLCEFIKTSWQPERGAENSPSLNRALKALMKI